ncbi:MAG TPA: hypothetical protein VFS89_03685 [Nitrosospira sp.]|nr:hypothetical protein [Nitrosospira sp.]
MKKIILIVCFSMLSGCAALTALQEKTATSYVAAEISEVEAAAVAKDMVNFLSGQFPAAKTTISLESSKSVFHEMLSDELAANGFGVVETKTEGAVPLRYFVTLLDGGVLVRMSYSGQVAGRYYPRSSGNLLFNTQYAVRGVVK